MAPLLTETLSAPQPSTLSKSSRVSVPVIASGGAGKKEDFLELFNAGVADAGLAASIFHFKEVYIKDLKKYLNDNNIEMRV